MPVNLLLQGGARHSSVAYADQIEKDHAAFKRAIRDGKVKAVIEKIRRAAELHRNRASDTASNGINKGENP